MPGLVLGTSLQLLAASPLCHPRATQASPRPTQHCSPPHTTARESFHEPEPVHRRADPCHSTHAPAPQPYSSAHSPRTGQRAGVCHGPDRSGAIGAGTNPALQRCRFGAAGVCGVLWPPGRPRRPELLGKQGRCRRCGLHPGPVLGFARSQPAVCRHERRRKDHLHLPGALQPRLRRPRPVVLGRRTEQRQTHAARNLL